ncbi:MAG TPA: hypothetical protein VNA69_23595 [Thermoanaerobaculia bacterium]|nr:hypothetical protein [Thermoanaerobaculia bacterium]
MNSLRFQFFVAVAVALLAAASPQAAERSNPRIATSGDGYLVIWNENDAIYGVRLNGAGHRLDSPRLIATGSATDVVWSGGTYIVGYKASPKTIASVSVTANGDVGSAAVVMENVRDCDAVELAATSTSLILSTGSGHRILSHATGEVREERGAYACGPLAVAAGDDSFTISRVLDGHIIWRSYSAAGASITGCCVTIGDPPPEDPFALALASDGSNYFHAYTRANGLHASGQRQRILWSVLFDHPLGAPRASWDGAQYVVTVASDRTLHLTRFDASVVPLGSPIAVEPMRAGEAADIAAHRDGRGAVVWIRENGDVRAGLFDVASLAAGTPFKLMTDVNRSTRRRAVR